MAFRALSSARFRAARLPAAVLVEVLERGVEVLVPAHPVHVHRRRDELLVVDRPVPVGVGLPQINARFRARSLRGMLLLAGIHGAPLS